MAKGRRLDGGREGGEIRILLDGDSIPAREGEPIAASLLAAGIETFARGVKYHRARGPFCMSGRCSHCVVQVDGEPNVYACLAPAAANLQVERQNAFPSAEHDLFATIDWFYPKGLDHHSLFAGVPVVEKVVAKVARQLAGLGKLPAAAKEGEASYLEHETEVLVVGGGPAGIAAALAAAKAGAQVSLLHDRPALGGRIATGPVPAGEPGAAWLEARRRELDELGVRLILDTAAFGAYREEGGGSGATPTAAPAGLRPAPEREDGSEEPSGWESASDDRPIAGEGASRLLVAARAPGRRLLVVRPQALVVATGANELLPLFPNNDLPGVFAGRALAALVSQHRVLPGERAVVAGDGAEAEALAALLRAEGCEVVAVVGLEPGPKGHIVRARGRGKVAGAVLADAGGAARKVRCDLIAVCDHRSALVDLARHAGAAVEWKEPEGFGVVVDAEGGTAAPDLFACGEVTGPCSISASIRQGEAAGRRAAVLQRSREG